MKFRSKTGEVFESWSFVPCNKQCQSCPISSMNNSLYEACIFFTEKHPHEAARLMGYEVVEDTSTDTLTGRGDELTENEDTLTNEANLDNAVEDDHFRDLTKMIKDNAVDKHTETHEKRTRVIKNTRVQSEKATTESTVEGVCCDCAHGGPCCSWDENEGCQYREEDGSCWVPYTKGEANLNEAIEKYLKIKEGGQHGQA